MTLRELCWMAKGRIDAQWSHTSALMVIIETSVQSLFSTGQIEMDLAKYHPRTRPAEEVEAVEPAPKGDISCLKVFLKKQRGA